VRLGTDGMHHVNNEAKSDVLYRQMQAHHFVEVAGGGIWSGSRDLNPDLALPDQLQLCMKPGTRAAVARW
jgi:hypothetical protein